MNCNVVNDNEATSGHAGLANVFVKQTLAKTCSKRLSETSPLVNWWGCLFEAAAERRALPLCLWMGWQDDSPHVSPQPYRVVE